MKLSLLYVSVLLSLCGCLDMKVRDEVVQSVVSSNGKWKAVVVATDAGATSSLSRAIWLVPASESDHQKGFRVFVADKCSATSVDWTNEAHLRIVSDGKVLILVSLYFDVRIEHQSKRV